MRPGRRPSPGRLGRIATLVVSGLGLSHAAAESQSPDLLASPLPPLGGDSLLAAVDTLTAVPETAAWPALLMVVGTIALLLLLFHGRSS